MAPELTLEPRDGFIPCRQDCGSSRVRLLEGYAVCAGDSKSDLVNTFDPRMEWAALVNGLSGGPNKEQGPAEHKGYGSGWDNPPQPLPFRVVQESHCSGFWACARPTRAAAAQRQGAPISGMSRCSNFKMMLPPLIRCLGLLGHSSP